MRFFFKWLGRIVVIIVLALVGCNIWVVVSTQDQIHDEIGNIEKTRLALVLGTSKRTHGGGDNHFFNDRIQAAAQLYKADKVDHILVSGDNRTAYYNEPADMLKALQAEGISSDDITLDYAGLRTRDSVVRCKEIFDQEEVIIVTQSFHAYRAVFIANYYNMTVQGYEANFDSQTFPALLFREFFARSLAVFDLYILNREPKILGEKEDLSQIR